MVLYNVTVGIDKDIEAEWVEWIKEKHIPDVMATKMFVEYKMFKVLNQDEEESISYSIQYFAKTIEDVVNYLDNHAPPLVREHRDRFLNKHVAFRTLLQQV
ncbi:DUF4286 family protein [Fulvivirga sp. RKSG066]|uniref:DUF4286 family protein n=1 Tax=Fulvivirga aurantia TaxID=2529383 RepID=UPI0012BCFD5F|nr:DUF4286 family protein [Fulvivirga aurantia]MTI20058.1 DUF4286 family protein [Fulvivirga aurantia]